MQQVVDMEANEAKNKQDGPSSSSIPVLLMAGILILLVLTGLLGYILISKGNAANKPELCLSNDCIASADRIISSMNKSVDPCDNFYEFACGGYMDTHPISETGAASRFGDLADVIDYRVMRILDGGIFPSMPETVKQVIDYYHKCIDKDTLETIGVEPMLGHIESLGLPKLPLQSDNAVKPSPWPQVLIKGDKLTARTPFFRVSIYQQNKTASHLTLEYERQPIKEDMFKRMLQALNKELDEDQIDAKKAAKQLFDLDDRLNNTILSREDTEPADIWVTVAELQKMTDKYTAIKGSIQFNWEEFLTSYLEDSIFDFDLEKEKIHVIAPNATMEVFKILYNTPPEQLELYMWFFYFDLMVPYTTPDLRDAFYVVRKESSPGFWKLRCSYMARQLFHNAVSYEYLTRYFDNKTVEKTEVIVHDIHDAFTQLIKGLDWMDEQTKTYALEKLDAVKQNVGYPKWFFVPGALDERNFFINDVRGDWLTMNINKFVVAFKKYDDFRFNDTYWLGISKIVVNAFYTNNLVGIYLPAGILDAPFTGNGLPALNYGAIGAVIGHEFTHGFDNYGHTIDKHGQKKNWWSNETLEKFDERVECMIEQYNKFEFPEIGPNVTLNGTQTINENIADNGGMREALIAYDMLKYRQTHYESQVLPDPEPYLPGLADYSHKQLFFLGYANMWCKNVSPKYLERILTKDVHSPGRERVLGTLSNTKEFADAWKCSAGSKMNPVEKCIVW
ncbi:Hypothetical predicted protein [Cloeon dipterum]|uniref:Peptidase M13 C-terminal domain-containing protein n=1 Tax=Cloeon dipterum TaxID=197152 RepID=A0A8S1DG69_9INSE|nr:Hypothetical predicted protein [Cloeon dipterum]